MSKVYFKKVTDKSEEKLSKAARELLEVLVKNENHTWEKTVPMKVHFGEKGNTTYIKPVCYKDVIEYMGENQIESAYIETNVLYRGSRTTRDSHIELAKEHGFTQLPIIIADGDYGEAYDEIKIDKEYFSTCKIGTEFSKYNQFLVMAHFKGHGSAGFGGAMKQLAMGFAARGGKLAQHSGISPKVIEKKCISCGLCVKKCDVEAIEMKEKAFIHSEKCVGCAGCIAVCPVGAIVNDWSEVNFKEKLAEYAYAAQKDKDNVYITYLINITKECDCMGQHMDEVASDIGVFISKDPVAIDTACIDMLQNQSDDKLFDDGRESIEHAVKIGFGSKDYELIELQ
ncbi:DUF362 domain-containing protein [Acetoanaerobium sticklandii]|uniref:DUF362 domain-containing protein n=1 Tax=Acetoanaerobium sticklandii TaxID=1511 RepID=UPI003A8DC0F3